MKNLRKKVYMAAGYNTIAMGSGRKEFNPKKERPGLEEYMKEAGQGVLKQIGGAQNVDECVVGNFMASRFNKQAHLGTFFPYVDPGLKGKPAIRVEGACGSGGLALMTGIRSILAETADVVLVIGIEVQNTVKAIYGADILGQASWFKERKEGHAYLFPGLFSDRAGIYYEKFGREKTMLAFAHWYESAIENARLCTTAQEYHNTFDDLQACALTEPNGRAFVDHLNGFCCSKVSDGACGIAIVSEEGLERIGIPKTEAVEVTGWGQAVDDITQRAPDLTELSTTRLAVSKALSSAGITIHQVSTAEVHDCFTIAGVMAVEAMGLAEKGKGADYIIAGNTRRTGSFPINTTGGLIGWGHPTGATGVHQAVTILEQLTGKAGANQVEIHPDRPYGLSVNMGGDDKTLVSIVYKRAE